MERLRKLLMIAVSSAGGLVLLFLVWIEVDYWSAGENYLRYHLVRAAMAAFGLAAVSFRWHRSVVLVAVTVMLFPRARRAPFDVTDLNYPRPPRLVPLVMGGTTWENSVRSSRGEIVLGGCGIAGNEPKWVLVW